MCLGRPYSIIRPPLGVAHEFVEEPDTREVGVNVDPGPSMSASAKVRGARTASAPLVDGVEVLDELE